ncbi:MAG: hypothetical protein SFT94_12375 [Pseudanabaenaceae cyanobacterium bins.68]|nr:hypothetical protein [Pseudanabaenaceae cyanobacterium bins.68]
MKTLASAAIAGILFCLSGFRDAAAWADPNSSLRLDSFQIDSSYIYNNFEFNTFRLEPSFNFSLPNGHRIILKTGYNFFSQNPRTLPSLRPDTITLTPIQLGWEGRVGEVSFSTALRINLYDKIPTTVGVLTSATWPVLPNLFLTAKYEQTALESTPASLQQGITARNYGPTLFWQIDPDMSLFSFYTITNYNDGNRAQVSYTKLERKFGQFAVSANLVTWGAENIKDAYFAPPDQLIYNLGVAWQGNLSESLNLLLQYNIGRQRFNREESDAQYYVVRLTAKLSDQIEGFLEFNQGDLRNTPGGQFFLGNVRDLFSQSTFTAQLKAKF